MTRREKLQTAIRYFKPNAIPGPFTVPFALVAKMGSTRTGSYVEGDQARSAGGQLLFKADGFLENLGAPFLPSPGATVTLNFYDKNTLAPLPGSVVYDYSADIDLVNAIPLSAPANYDAFLKPYLSGGTGAFSDSATPGEITVGLTKQLFGENNALMYDDAAEVGVSMQIGASGFNSNTATSWYPVTCTTLDYAYIEPMQIDTSFNNNYNVWFSNWNIGLSANFTRVSPITIEGQGGLSDSGEPGDSISGVSGANWMVYQTFGKPMINVPTPSFGDHASMKISFTVRHSVTLEEFTVFLLLHLSWNSSSELTTTRGILQAIPAYAAPSNSVCNSTSFIFADVDGTPGLSFDSAQLLEGATDITPGGLSANSLTPITYHPGDEKEVVFRVNATTVDSNSIYAESNLIQVMKKI